MQTLADIEALRERLGVSQKDLCEKADVHQSTLSRARTLHREPTARIRRKLEAALEAIAAERGIVPVEKIDTEDGQ
ncbi:helix-turn-helix domain-containing protein [Sinorhizobium fredii]|uniref:helix-turn-helix domain-containing protein n=1 Tax=Rhizobium fredii TaxID=380 RepID=UPI00351614D3